MRYLIITCSHRSLSRSQIMAEEAYRVLEQSNESVELVRLAELELPFCDAETCYDHPAVVEMERRITEADGILLASPVYNFSLNAAAKNLLELTGSAWKEKIVGFLCAAGGHGSYMSIMPFANSLMLDFRCVIIPRFVYAQSEAFEDGKLIDSGIKDRIDRLTTDLVRFTQALRE